tara:strand:- start:10756 stop:10971 length:216 start_codon:yes stop_codon:yes gene_type:complete
METLYQRLTDKSKDLFIKENRYPTIKESILKVLNVKTNVLTLTVQECDFLCCVIGGGSLGHFSEIFDFFKI